MNHANDYLTHSPAGHEPEEFTPGDFFLTHRNTFFGWAIWLVQRLIFRGKDRTYAFWTHAGVIVSPDGAIIEAINHGVCRGHISKYRSRDYVIVHIDPVLHRPLAERNRIIEMAYWAEGQRYAWIQDAVLAIGLLSRLPVSLVVGAQQFCSGLVARCLEHGTWLILDPPPARTTPGHLAKLFSVPGGDTSVLHAIKQQIKRGDP